MKVYKFGGASVKDAAGIRNLAKIVFQETGNLVVVVSALGKTTNALEKVLKAWMNNSEDYTNLLDEVFAAHFLIIYDLFGKGSDTDARFRNSFAVLREYLLNYPRGKYDFEYDQIVSYGEVLSTIIVAEYLRTKIKDAEWVDLREILLTDDRFRDANVLWSESTKRVRNTFDFTKKRIFITQGFIGGTVAGHTTTLGREGSDYTAAILANMLDAESVVVWKDVPGILNADPNWFPDAVKLDEISYREAVEMSFSGAKVIHPKTIKPLHNKNIPLYVKSFLDPAKEGTVIKADITLRKILISILPKDFSFVMGDNLSMIFHTFIKHGIKVNLVEASAVSIDVCIDDERAKVDSLIDNLKDEYSVVYNGNVEMLSIRHSTPEAICVISEGREILLEQRTRSTVRFVVRKE